MERLPGFVFPLSLVRQSRVPGLPPNQQPATNHALPGTQSKLKTYMSIESSFVVVVVFFLQYAEYIFIARLRSAHVVEY